MSKASKDSPEVVAFMNSFAQLKDWIDDAPEQLTSIAKSDSSVKDLCFRLFDAGHMLTMNERRRRDLFASPVDPAFQTAWREFEDRYQEALSGIWLADLGLDISPGDDRTSKADVRWENADADAMGQARGIDEAIRFAEFNVDQEDRWDDSHADFIYQVREGIAAFDRLRQDVGLDLQSVFRRRALIPFVLVPRHVAAKHASADKLSWLRNLQQAHEAFVYGATHAALALMRSIMEAVLRDHYRAQGADLADLIRNAARRLPPGANIAALDRLRRLANAILHLDPVKDQGLGEMDTVRLEKEIVSLLFVLRALIEGAK